jgi:hypothetical protein
LAKVNARKLPVGILQREADRRYDLGPTATDLGLGELEAVRLYDADAVLRAGNGIQDRLAAHLDESLDLGAGPAAVDVELEIDVGDDRVVEGVAGRGEHLIDGGARLGVIAVQDAQQGLALLGRGAPVDDMQAFALALMDRTGPAEDARASEPVKPRRAVKALLNVEDRQAPAVAVRRQGVELARAAIIAIAVAELAPLDLPRDHLCTSSDRSTGAIEACKNRSLQERGGIMAPNQPGTSSEGLRCSLELGEVSRRLRRRRARRGHRRFGFAKGTPHARHE